MAARKRHSGELLDAILAANLPRVPGVHSSTVRLVLVMMAQHTNPNRDQARGADCTWRCWPSVRVLAEESGRSERQVQRVLQALEEHGWITLEQPAVWAGRHREPRAAVWCLRPDSWAIRSHGLDKSDIPIDGLDMVSNPSNGLDIAGQWVGHSGQMGTTQRADGLDKVSAQLRNRTHKELVSEPAAAAAFPRTDFSNQDEDEAPRSRCEQCGEFYVTATMHDRRCIAVAAPEDIVHCPTCPGGGRNMTRAALRTHQCRGKQVAS